MYKPRFDSFVIQLSFKSEYVLQYKSTDWL